MHSEFLRGEKRQPAGNVRLILLADAALEKHLKEKEAKRRLLLFRGDSTFINSRGREMSKERLLPYITQFLRFNVDFDVNFNAS